jgi:multicomponent Na+:H+ antiporter subunit D
VTLFLFYEALTFSTYPLVTHHRTVEAMRAGRVYLGVLVGTSVALFLLAIVWTWDVAGTTEFRVGGILGDVAPAVTVGLLVCYAFGIGKAALMPFHRWLPAAMVAPTPVSALLHAVAVVKAGVFCILKIVVYVFGPHRLMELSDTAREGVWGFLSGSGWLLAVASFTILAASTVALFQDNLKRRLAYSTISQLSYIVLGAALAAPSAILGASLHILTHAVGKITLFFCAGAFNVGAHKTRVSELKGIGRRMPLTSLSFLLASLSIIGLPPLAGAWSKWFLALGALEAGREWVIGVLVVSSLLNVAYLLPIPMNAFFARSSDEDDDEAAAPAVREAPWLCVLPLMVTAVMCLALFLFIDPWIELLRPLGGLP